MIGALAQQCFVSFLASVAFSVLFHAPRSHWAWCGITGMAGWAVYWLSVGAGTSPAQASLAAAMALAVLARVLAVARRCPATVFLTAGIFPLVPGAGIYYTAYYFIRGDNVLAVEKGVETLKIAVAIAVGIVLVLALPGRLFRLFGARAAAGRGRNSR